MASEKCFTAFCVIPLDPTGSKLFGFSEFLAGLALMVLAWTIGDVRYRFRIRTAPIPLQRLTFTVVAAIGVLTLLTDLWRAEGWLVPQGNLLTPASWQALLAGVFLLTFLTWAWFAFIKRPTFGKRNAERFAQTLYRYILKGDPTELAVIADELTYSVKALVRYAPDRTTLKHHSRQQDKSNSILPLPKVGAYANDLLLLLADKRLCRVIIESSPGTALAIFQEISKRKKFGINIGVFAQNIVREALLNSNSFLYHETEGYESGLIGYHKPLSQAMFANHIMVETIRTLLDPDTLGHSKWNAAQWEAYCRLVLISLRDYTDKSALDHSIALNCATTYIQSAVSGLYKLNGVANTWENDTVQSLQIVMAFIRDAVKILEDKGVSKYTRLRVRVKYGQPHESFYDLMASMIFEIIFHASAVNSPWWDCWSIQHNSIWGQLRHTLEGEVGRVIDFKLRRILYNEVLRMNKFPNFKGAKILAFCLNVMGLKLSNSSFDKNSRPLHKAMLAWTKKNYVSLHNHSPSLAEACLVDRISYDAENLRLIKTYPADGLLREPQYEFLELDPDKTSKPS
ncbi:hypothetical protein [Pseudomonas tussilaginis]|uniref:hypothetical protein n=1 Tax=Pseudomonas sp. 5 TaxID=1619949 RepID=UPI0005EBEECD|nr:hypothetical protein [Pseudomonas sp. 5]